MEIVRHGKYKSAVEPFLRDDMSEANREQITELLTSIWETISTEASESRDIPLERFNDMVDKFVSRNSEGALKNRLVDGILYKDQYENILKSRIGIEKDDDINIIKLSDYISGMKKNNYLERERKDKIAVIYAEGEIKKSFKGPYGEAGISYESMRKALREVSKDDDVKAIVLRVNSPGGDAMESDMIWREIEIAKKKKKVYISMGNYAASGGYYIACGADKIFAEKTTITGSIGVFAMLPNAGKLANKIGIHSEQVSTHKNSSPYSIFKPLSGSTRDFIKESIDHIYDRFLSKVAKGRGLKVTYVDSIAQGRVWTGEQGKKIGLVDEIGGVDDAIEMAADGLSDYSIVNYPKKKLNLENIISEISKPIKVGKLPFSDLEILRPFYEDMKMIEAFSNGGSKYYTRLPYKLNIK
ncbi:protease 4 [Elysia marginata]|uniref:Protease 4 n=1 Tax=Elysia marginata TaxID=1093978 RepID=A0AAV4FV34_9GAST|nr:protease 4 [Elysia marginata]